jgi:pimeloyl-ACP methyl ester carboxylesterase
MPMLDVDDARLAYSDEGQGDPLVLLPGWSMSAHFFHRQIPSLSQHHRVIAVDYRSHGQSPTVLVGHSLITYARDVHALLETLDLDRVTLAGWSMGSMVIWEYLKLFGTQRLKAMVNIDQGPTDVVHPDWPHNTWTLYHGGRMAVALQDDQRAVVRDFIPHMFVNPPSEADLDWMTTEMLLVPAPVAGVTLLDNILQDYRDQLPNVALPTLLCFGHNNIPSGEYIVQHQPDARLVVFGHSGHCPFLEESERFNAVVDEFIARLS